MSNIPPFGRSRSNKRQRLEEPHTYDEASVENPWANSIQPSTAPETVSTVSLSNPHSAPGSSGRGANDEALIQVSQSWSNWDHNPSGPGFGGIIPTSHYHGWSEGQSGSFLDYRALWAPNEALTGAGSSSAATIAIGTHDQRPHGATPYTYSHETLWHGCAVSQLTVDYNSPNFQHRLPIADDQLGGSLEVCPQSQMAPNPPNTSMYAPNCSLSSGPGSYQEFGGPIGDESALNAAVTESDLICFGMVSNSLSSDSRNQTVLNSFLSVRRHSGDLPVPCSG